MKSVHAVILWLMLTGCVHRDTQEVREEFVSNACIVEEFNPDTLVFYSLDSIPYDSSSRVSRVRVIEPANLAGRIFSIDLMPESEKKDEGFEDLRRLGAKVRFKMPAIFGKNTEKQLVPVHMLKKAPNQSPETGGTAPAVKYG